MTRAPAAPFDTLQRAHHRTLHEHAYQQIRAALMVGRFVPGQKMTIRGLAQALNISPTPIREALHRLSTEGALRAGSNRRLMVPQLSIGEFRELRDIRLALEGLATERAVPQIEPQELSVLRATDADIRARRRAGDVAGTIRSIHQFHHTLYGAARMPALKHLIEGLWLRNGPYLHLLFPDFANQEQGRQRAETLSAIERGDAQAAAAAMRADLSQTAEYLIGLLSHSQAVHATA
jgi:DNA-binding GntR family transcriptional regulator